MFTLFLFFALSSIMVMFLKIISLFLSESSNLSREELTSYECGFEHRGLSRVPFSLRYFFLTLIFLLFDLEIVLLLFFPFSFVFSFLNLSVISVFFFVSFLFLGLLYEWSDGSLEWVM